MSNQIQTITDKEQFEDLFVNYFGKNDTLFKVKDGYIKLHFLGFSQDHVGFRIPQVKSLPENIVVFTKHKSNVINATLQLIERNEDSFTFLPQKVQIISERRKEDRNLLSKEGGSKNILYITNLMSDDIIKSSITHGTGKIDKIDEIVKFDLEKQFDRSKIFFGIDGKSDERICYILENRLPIFIPDLNSEPDGEEKETYDYYINEIYSKDHELSRNHEFVSEATVPIYYRNMIIYGYIQVNNKSKMTDGQLEVLKRQAIVIDQLCNKSNLFPVPDAKFLVSDISKDGMGIVFKDKKLASYIMKDGFIVFDVMLPTSKKVITGSKIANVEFLENNIIKAGLENLFMDHTSRTNYDEYIQILEKNKK